MPIRPKRNRTTGTSVEQADYAHTVHLVSPLVEPALAIEQKRLVPSDCMEVTLRRYTSADLGAMVALDAACFTEEFLFGETVMKILAENPYALTVIADTADGAMAGFAIAHQRQEENPDAAYLVTLDVDSAFRRCGIGSGLLRAIERVLLESGVRSMQLHVHTANLSAMRFYEAYGFRRKDRILHFYGAGGKDAYLYEKTLGAPTAWSTRARTSVPRT